MTISTIYNRGPSQPITGTAAITRNADVCERLWQRHECVLINLAEVRDEVTRRLIEQEARTQINRARNMEAVKG